MSDIEKAARELVAKIEAIHDDPAYQGIWVLAHNHGLPYLGPNYADELARLKTALDAVTDANKSN